jgi:hypothetical protein
MPDAAYQFSSMSDAKAQDEDGVHHFWDVLERSVGGHERRRRLAWRMTDEEALEWQAAVGGKLIRASGSEHPFQSERLGKPARQARNDDDER